MTAGPGRHTCSRAGCRLEATSAIEWRNPRIHTDGRFKTWLACEQHVAELVEFLAARAFPLEVKRFDPSAERVR